MFKMKATAEEIKLAKEFMQTVPVSFEYGDTKFPQDFLQKDGAFVSADGKLKCEIPFTTFADSAAVEWLPRFTSVADENTKQIKNVLALDVVFPVDGEVEVFYAKGAGKKMDDFSFGSTKIADEPVTFKSLGSRIHIPFLNLKTGSGGVMIGLGFTSWWNVTFEPVKEGIHVTVYLNDTNFYLLPKESLRHILMLLIFWKGDLARSFNLLRNHLVVNCIPKGEDGEPCPPICCQTWGGMKTENHLKYIKFLKENDLKFDCYWMDAGWHGPDHETDEFQDCNKEDWAYHHGEWLPNHCPHPDGLTPISEAAHDAGMTLLLWFGTYVCNENMGWHKEHPEWAIGYEQHKINKPIARGVGLNPTPTIHYTLNLEIPEAREWIADRVSTTLIENKCGWYREDCGVPMLPDEPNRIGVGEMKSVEYLYEFWDRLLERVPGLKIDNCGGGGTRIDLETIKRSYVLWRSDYNCHPGADPIGAQVGNYGLGHFIPFVNCAPPVNPGSNYTFHSGLYGGMGFPLFHIVGFGDKNPEKHTWFAPDYPVKWHKEMIDHYQIAKPYLGGNFYALTETSIERDAFLSYQFSRPDLEGGIILGFFRPEYAENSAVIQPYIEDGTYTFENVSTGKKFEMEIKGKTSITLTVDKKPESVLLHYKKLK